MLKPVKILQDLVELNSPPPEGCLKGGVVINQIPIKLNPILDLPFNVKLKERAKALRHSRNLPEVLFWMQISKGKFHKLDFDRQRIIGNYIVDFYVKKLGLIIEIDGASHDDKLEYDQLRASYLISLSLRIYRISVDDVMKNMDFALMGLENYIIENYGLITN